jgi:hypothetical protein
LEVCLGQNERAAHPAEKMERKADRMKTNRYLKLATVRMPG